LCLIEDGERTQTAKRSLVPSVSECRSKRSHVHELVVNDEDVDAKKFDDIDDALTKFQKPSCGSKSALKDNNAEWNKIHVELRKTLEETGQIQRFGIKHLSLWTDLIQKGDVAGPREEPDWSKYQEIVEVVPISRKPTARKSLNSDSANNSMTDLLTTMLLQQEMRREDERAEAARHKHIDEMNKIEYERKQQQERTEQRNQQTIFQAVLLKALSPMSVSTDPYNASTYSANNTPLSTSHKGKNMNN